MRPADRPKTSLGADDRLDRYPLLDALMGRRSRRFGPGMKIESGPFAYESRHEPLPLTEAEEGTLAFAACGVTGYALADLAYGRGQGGSMLAGLIGRTVASPDALNVVSVILTNDEATFLLKRPQDFAPEEIPILVDLAKRGELVELYRRSRVRIGDGRAVPHRARLPGHPRRRGFLRPFLPFRSPDRHPAPTPGPLARRT